VGRGRGERLTAGWAAPRSEGRAGDQADPPEPKLSEQPPADSGPVCEPVEVDHRSDLSGSEPTQKGVLIPDSGLTGYCWLLLLLAAGLCWLLLVAATAGWCWLLVDGGFCWILLTAAAAGWQATAAGSTLLPVVAGWLVLQDGSRRLLAVVVGRLQAAASGRPLEGLGGTPLRYICRANAGHSWSSRRGRRDLVQSRWQSLVSLRTSSLQVEAPPLTRRTCRGVRATLDFRPTFFRSEPRAPGSPISALRASMCRCWM
jgi:hypothetical protein